MTIYFRYIYKITNQINQKIYIGKTNNPIKRFKTHYNPKSNSVIAKAIQKYGKDNFKFEIIEVIQFLEKPTDIDIILYLNAREMFYISKFKSNDNKCGYNRTNGGDGVDSETARILSFRRSNERIIANNTRIHTCPNCGKVGKGNVMLRFHFENCGNEEKRKVPFTHNFKTSTNLELVKEWQATEHTCPHCGMFGRGSVMKRHHFERCKHKEKS